MSEVLRRATLFGLMLGLAGCGFRPVYGPRSDQAGRSQEELGTIHVALLPERSGQLVRQALQARLDRGEGQAKRFELSVSVGVASDAIGVQQDTSITRVRLVGTANWTLKNFSPPQSVVTTGFARTLDGVNVLDQQYFDLDLEGESVTQRIAAALADQITLQLAAYFARLPTARPT